MKHLPFWHLKTNPSQLDTLAETRSEGQFHWGGVLLKGNAGVLRCTKLGWKSSRSCNGVSALDCEGDNPSRDESRS